MVIKDPKDLIFPQYPIRLRTYPRIGLGIVGAEIRIKIFEIAGNRYHCGIVGGETPLEG